MLQWRRIGLTPLHGLRWDRLKGRAAGVKGRKQLRLIDKQALEIDPTCWLGLGIVEKFPRKRRAEGREDGLARMCSANSVVASRRDGCWDDQLRLQDM